MARMRPEILSGNPTYETVAKSPPPELPQGPTVLQPGHQETNSYPSGLSNDKLIARDRHASLNRGSENTGRKSGLEDPLLSGPARPSLRLINRTINYQQGSDGATQDDPTRAYTKDSQGKWVGQQDGSIQPVYGGTPGLFVPYGSYAGYTTGPVRGIQGAEPGSPQDGPQVVRAGPPHGLHTATFPDYSQTLGRYMATPQQVGGRVDRPANSPIAGQSYSQTVVPQGQSGTNAIRTQSASHPRTVGFKPGSGWRGA